MASEPRLKRRKYIVVDGETVGWIAARVEGLHHAFIAVGDGRWAHGVGATRERAMTKAWSARHVLCSESDNEQPTEEKT